MSHGIITITECNITNWCNWEAKENKNNSIYQLTFDIVTAALDDNQSSCMIIAPRRRWSVLKSKIKQDELPPRDAVSIVHERFKKRNYHWVISMILSVRQVIIFMIVVIQNEYNCNALSSCVTVIIRIHLLSNKFYHSNWLSIYVYTVYRINVMFQYKCMKTNLDCFCGEATSWVFHFYSCAITYSIYSSCFGRK